MTKIAFRVDGGPRTGLGHVMRSLALAKEFPGNIEISFITKSNKEVQDLILDSGFEILTLDSNLDYKNELAAVKELIKTNNIDIIITDSYELDQNYLIELKKIVNKLVSIHDFVPYKFPANIVVNGNIYAPKLDYQSTTGNNHFLLGPKYTLMREEFQEVSRTNINKEVNSILVTVGGSDKLNLTPKIIAALNKLEQNLHVDVVVGPGFNNEEQIVNLTKESDLEVSLHFNVTQMSKLMLNNDLAISAGGSTLYELAATGTPTITLLQADNQVKVAQAMAEQEIVINLGFGNKVNEQKLNNSITRLIKSFNLRKEMSEKGQEIVDGQGAKRVAEIILNN